MSDYVVCIIKSVQSFFRYLMQNGTISKITFILALDAGIKK
jgi:hypothetical protein